MAEPTILCPPSHCEDCPDPGNCRCLCHTETDMSDLSARVSPLAQLEALGDWRGQLDQELAEMAATSRRIGRLARRAV